VADDLPTVLNLLYESDARRRDLRAEGEEWSDEERSKEAFLRSVRPGAVVGMRGHPGPAERVRRGRPCLPGDIGAYQRYLGAS